MAKQITEFINDVLAPRYWDNINSIFPDMHFTLNSRNGRLESLKHYDGADKKGANSSPNSLIYPATSHLITDHSMTPQTIKVFNLFMQRNNITEPVEAVKRLCSIMNIPEPEYTPEDREKYKAFEQRRALLEESRDRQSNALFFTEEGEKTLNYLLNRGWTQEEIAKTEFGHISKDEAALIGATGYPYSLSIPVTNGSVINGFKFRDITGTMEDKYRYLKGTSKRHFSYLTGRQMTDGTITIVEGEIDAIHAMVRGVENVVATAGGAVTPDMLDQAIERGVKRIVLLLDRDEKGEEFVRNSIDLAFSKGVSVFVAALPDETLPDGKKVKDVDDYLKLHAGAEDLKALIAKAEFGATYLVNYHATQTLNSVGGDAAKITPIEYDKLKEKIIGTINATKNETERYNAVQKFAEKFGMDIETAISTIKAEADRQRAEAAQNRQKERAEALVPELATLVAEGKTKEALRKMKDEGDALLQLDNKETYSDLLRIDTMEELFKRMKSKTPALATSYLFESKDGYRKEALSLPSGAITFIVAPTSHGKSTLLQNLAIQIVKSKEEGVVLYFTYEEDGDSVDLQLLNKYMNFELCKASHDYLHSNNIDALTHFGYSTEYPERYIKESALGQFHEKLEEFRSQIYDSGKLRVFFKDFYSDELIAAIRYISSQTKVKAVFIDYIQELYKKGNKLQRTEELKEICNKLKELCIETQLPVIVAAQANREVSSPLEMENRRIADSADLERIANKVVFIWNSSFKPQSNKDNKKDLEDFEKETGITLGVGGKIYAKLTKNRGGSVNLDAVLDFNGNTGVITQSEKPKPQQGKVNNSF